MSSPKLGKRAVLGSGLRISLQTVRKVSGSETLAFQGGMLSSSSCTHPRFGGRNQGAGSRGTSRSPRHSEIARWGRRNLKPRAGTSVLPSASSQTRTCEGVTGLLVPCVAKSTSTVVCPAKADTFSGSQSRQGKSQSLVARMAGRRGTESLKPIDKAIFGMAASHRAVVQTNTDVAPKV